MRSDINPNPESSSSQKAKILDYMRQGHGITPIDALRMFGCFRLGARISEIKKDGWIVRTEMVKDDLTGKRYAMYSLPKDPVQLNLF
jgi:hypothetical protein